MSNLTYRTLEWLVGSKKISSQYFVDWEAYLDKCPVVDDRVYHVLENVGYVRKSRSLDDARSQDYTFKYPCRVDYDVNWRCFMVTSSWGQRLLTFDSKNIEHVLQDNLTLFLGT